MISYEFTAGKTDPIFRLNDPEGPPTLNWIDGAKTDYMEVPLRLLIPHGHVTEVGADWMQERITAAVDKMVKELNGDV